MEAHAKTRSQMLSYVFLRRFLLLYATEARTMSAAMITARVGLTLSAEEIVDEHFVHHDV
jgi:hypothetical protein